MVRPKDFWTIIFDYSNRMVEVMGDEGLVEVLGFFNFFV